MPLQKTQRLIGEQGTTFEVGLLREDKISDCVSVCGNDL